MVDDILDVFKTVWQERLRNVGVVFEDEAVGLRG